MISIKKLLKLRKKYYGGAHGGPPGPPPRPGLEWKPSTRRWVRSIYADPEGGSKVLDSRSSDKAMVKKLTDQELVQHEDTMSHNLRRLERLGKKGSAVHEMMRGRLQIARKERAKRDSKAKRKQGLVTF